MRSLPIPITVDVRLDGRSVRQLDRIERKLDHLLEGQQIMTTQNEEVRQLVQDLGGDVASLRETLTGVGGDVAYLKAKLDELPVGQPIDEATMSGLRGTVNGVHEVTAQFIDLDASTEPPADEPTEPAPPVSPEPGAGE